MAIRANLDKQTADIAGMFDAVAGRYDLMNDLMSGGMVRLWRRATLAALDARPGDTVLDLAAGTGTSSVPLAANGASVFPTDLSLGMLRTGREKHPHLQFVNADGTALPYADHSFDAATISFGLRNVADTAAALREIHRVTKPGGTLVICEFSTPGWAPFRGLYRWYLEHVLPRFQPASTNGPAYDYLTESILDWHDQPTLAGYMTSNGWDQVQWKNLTGGIVALHRGTAE